MKLPIDTVQQARFDCLVEAMMRMTFLHRLLDIAMDSGHRSFVRGTVYGARCSADLNLAHLKPYWPPCWRSEARLSRAWQISSRPRQVLLALLHLSETSSRQLSIASPIHCLRVHVQPGSCPAELIARPHPAATAVMRCTAPAS